MGSRHSNDHPKNHIKHRIFITTNIILHIAFVHQWYRESNHFVQRSVPLSFYSLFTNTHFYSALLISTIIFTHWQPQNPSTTYTHSNISLMCPFRTTPQLFSRCYLSIALSTVNHMALDKRSGEWKIVVLNGCERETLTHIVALTRTNTWSNASNIRLNISKHHATGAPKQ